VLNGYDIDGVLGRGVRIERPCVCISGRTLAEWDGLCAQIAQQMPIFIRGMGGFGDVGDAGRFKARMINGLGVTKFYEDDPEQARIIIDSCANCKVVLVA
jgi:hypothetical protein